MAAVPMPLKPFFNDGFRTAIGSHKIWEHDYECSSPEIFRIFHMAAYQDPEGDGLVVVNSIRVERPHDNRERDVCFPDKKIYEDDSGFVAMCCNCRRTNRPGRGNVWDWVPAYVNRPPLNTSHGICSVCLNLYYPKIVGD